MKMLVGFILIGIAVFFGSAGMYFSEGEYEMTAVGIGGFIIAFVIGCFK